MSTASVSPSPTESSGRSSLPRIAALIAKDIKLAHSVFALPFAILASFLAGPKTSATGGAWLTFFAKLAIVIVCMVGARTWAMLVNRLADRAIDAENDRTKRRVFASGALTSRTGWLAACMAAGLFVFACSMFWIFFGNPWPVYLAVPVLGWIAFYSFTKRFTALCHVFLGGALGASPLAAAIAINPASLSSTPAVWWLSLFVVLWVAGFDVIYALQDQAFDKAKGLSSIPAKLGTTGALWASRALHAGAFIALLSAWTSEPRFGGVFSAGLVIVGLLLIMEHVVATRRGQRGIDMAFFTLNGIVSCVLGVLGVIDLL